MKVVRKAHELYGWNNSFNIVLDHKTNVLYEGTIREPHGMPGTAQWHGWCGRA